MGGGGGGGRLCEQFHSLAVLGHSLAVLGKYECLCASILVYGMKNQFLRVGVLTSGNLILTRP